MKIKTDFVTNSSSSSFVVIGSHIDAVNIPIEVFQKIKAKVQVTIENILEDPYEYIDPLLRGTDLQWSAGCEYDDGLMIGIPYTSMGEDETLKQFRQRVQEGIKQYLGIDTTPGHIEECWMDN